MKQFVLTLLLLVRSFGNPLVILGGNGQVVGGGGGGAGTDPGTTGLLAKYNFADASDSHGSYTLEVAGTPVYLTDPTRGVASELLVNRWSNGDLDNVWTSGSGARCFAIRFKTYGAFATTDTIAAGGGSVTKFRVSKEAGGLTVYLAGVGVTVPVTINQGVWYCVVGSTDGAGNLKVWLNGANETTGTGTNSYANGSVYLGSDRFGASVDVEIDYAWFANSQYTADNAVWFYNNGETRE